MSLFEALSDGFFDEKPTRPRTTYRKGPFSMAGSKHSSLQHIMHRLEYRKTFVDVFGGSGIVSINRNPSPQLNVYNDANSGAVSFFRVLREVEGRNRLVDYFNKTIHSREDFIICKETWKNEKDDIERACKWLHMIRGSVLGRGVSHARQTHSKATFPLQIDESVFRKLHRWARSTHFENLDYRFAIEDYDSEDSVFYCDPPYLSTDVSTYGCSWTEEDQRALLTRIQNGKGFFALSGYPLKMNEELVDWDERHEWKITARSDIMGKKNNPDLIHKQETEVLWIKK